MPELEFRLIDEASFDEIPEPAQHGARCQTCDYWERLDGGRERPESDADQDARRALKRNRLLAARDIGGSYAMLAYHADSVGRSAVGYAQFGPLSAYPRAQTIRDRYPQLPESPSPWVITCLQVSDEVGDAVHRQSYGRELLEAVCDELDRRGIMAVEAYPESVAEAWVPPSGPPSVYVEAGFERAAGDDHYPVFRRELSGQTDAGAWAGLLRRTQPDDDDDPWPLPLPKRPTEDDLFRLPQKPRRPNPFGED